MQHSPNNVVNVDAQAPQSEAIDRAAVILRSGGLVAFPTETVYGLGAHALDPAAVRKIFAAKDRPGWDPLIVHVNSVAMALSLAEAIPALFDQLATTFWPGPLTLVVNKAGCVPDEVTAGRATVALRMPRHPVATALLAAAQLPIAAPSANRFGRPSPTCAGHVCEDLGDRVDLILDAGPTPLGVESTVLDLTQSPPAILRPGGVSHEALTAVLGHVSIAGSVADAVAAQGLAAPGMTLKHYAPRTAIELFDGAPEDVARQLQARCEQLRQSGRKFGVLNNQIDSDHFARTLFAQLREFDAAGVAVILCVLPPPAGIGLAVRDRLKRAAGRGDQS